MRVGLVGAGRIGRVHARSIADNPATRLVIVSDPNVAAAAEVADRYGARVAGNADEVCAADDVDAVIICSPTPLHADHVYEAAANGKAVLCEKPVASSYAEAVALEHRLAGIDARVMVGFNRRFDPSFAHARSTVEQGGVGVVEQVTVISRDPAAPPREYILGSGGIFKDMTIHDFDMVRFLLGDVESVFSTGQNLDPALADTEDFDAAVTVLRTSSGKIATITNSRHCAVGYDQRLEVFGTEGSIFVENVLPHAARVSNASVSQAQARYLDFFLERYREAYSVELAAFVSAVDGERPFSPSLEDGTAALRLAEAADESAHTGHTVVI